MENADLGALRYVGFRDNLAVKINGTCIFLEIYLSWLSTCANDQQLEMGDMFLATSFCQLLFAFCCPYAQSISPPLLHNCLNLHFQQIH